MTQKEERNWKRIADLEVEVGKMRIEMAEMEARLIDVERMLRQPEAHILELRPVDVDNPPLPLREKKSWFQKDWWKR